MPSGSPGGGISGDGMLSDGECRVPPYPPNLQQINLSEDRLLTEGRCYLACLADGLDYEVSFSLESNFLIKKPDPCLSYIRLEPQSHNASRPSTN